MSDEQKAVAADMTPYYAAKLMTHWAEQRGLLNQNGKPLKYAPQAMYSRAGKGAFGAYKMADGTVMFDGEKFMEWARAEIGRRERGEVKGGRVDVAELAKQYAL